LGKAEPGGASISLPADEARKKLGHGQYLLQDLELELDVPSIAGLLLQLAAAAAGAGESVDTARFSAWIRENEDDLGMILQDVLAGEGRLRSREYVHMGMDAGLFRILAKSALMPHMRAWARQLTPLSAGVSWKRNTCFVCGARPVLGELQGNGQALHLRCGLCGVDWEYSRLACVHCGNEDHRSREYLFPEPDHRMAHVEACTRCKTYLKVIPAFAPSPVDLLAVEDLSTVHLDQAAEERGYRRAGP
jgi:FdhE protein